MPWRQRPSGLLVPDDTPLDELELDELAGEPGCTEGVCRRCGYCAWTDETQTLCTGCVS